MKRKDYDSLSDAKLVQRFREGDAAAADYLCEKYKQLVRTRARALYLMGGDREDLLQEGMLGLFRAIRTYDVSRKDAAAFKTYAAICVSHQMYSAIEASTRKKNAPLNAAVSIQEIEEQQDDLRLGTAASPEAIFLDREASGSLMSQIQEILSPYERRVLALFLEGMGYTQIADILGRTPKSVDNALQRIRTKVQHILE